MSDLKIPGLLAKKNKDSKLTQAQLEAKQDSFEAFIKNWQPNPHSTLNYDQQKQQGLEQLKSVSYTGGLDPYNGSGVIPLTIGDFPMQQKPYTEPYNPFDQPWKNPGPFGGPLNRRDTDYKEYADYLQEMLKPKKSEFEVLLDAMFDTSEKEQFLITLGFEFTHENGEDWISRTVAGLLEKGKKADLFDEIFLREMTIKFKNLLISKNSLKMKLGG